MDLSRQQMESLRTRLERNVARQKIALSESENQLAGINAILKDIADKANPKK